MLSIDPVHQNSGGVAAATSSTPVTVSLAGGETTEAGNTLVVILAGGNAQNFASAPAGWALRVTNSPGGDDPSVNWFIRGPAQGLAAGESSWDFTPTNATAGPVRWTVLEYEGIATHTTVTGNVVDATSGAFGTGVFSGTTAGVLTALTSTYDGLALSSHTSYNPSGTDTWSGHTDGFVEIAAGSQAGTGSDNVSLSVSALPVQRLGTYGATATLSRTITSADPAITASNVLTAAGARRAADLHLIDGVEHGIITGNTLGPGNTKVIESATAGVSVSSSAARSGGSGWLLSSTSAACNIIQYNATQLLGLGTGFPVFRVCFRFPTLPGADVEMWVLRDIGTAALITLRFITATSKIGLKVGSGVEQVSDTTITANQWFGVDIGADMSTTAHAVDWAVDYNAELTDTTAGVAQTQATATGSANPTLGSIRRGWTTATTATMHTDDQAGSGTGAHYPIGDLRVLPAKVDPAGTPTISGTATNFGVMTGNGTVAAWNAVNARNAVDDIPPDLSGTRDAAVAVLAHASDYAEFPTEPLDLAALGVSARGVRYVGCLWAASATAATIRQFAYDGTTQYTILAETDPQADNTATPVWVSKVIRPGSGRIDWTQAKLDALAFRFGSNDATPDIGVDAYVFEVAVVKARPEELFGETGAPVHVTVGRDPDTNAIIDMDATTVGAGATVDYELDEVPQTQIVAAADTTEHRDVGGEDFQSVNRIEVQPD